MKAASDHSNSPGKWSYGSSPPSVAPSSHTSQGSPLSTNRSKRSVSFEGPSPAQDQPNATTVCLRNHVLRFNPPPNVQTALRTMQQARERLTIQVYYAAPTFFEDKGLLGGADGHQVRVITTSLIVQAAKALGEVEERCAMKAALALLGEEMQALSALLKWTHGDLAETDGSSIEPIQRCAINTLEWLQEAKWALLMGLMPESAKGTPACLFTQRAESMMRGSERSSYQQAGILKSFASEPEAAKESKAMRKLVDSGIGGSLQSAAKDLGR